MPPAEMPFHRGFAVETAVKPSTFHFHHHEQWPVPNTSFFDDTPEASSQSWESLWIDMGGEG